MSQIKRKGIENDAINGAKIRLDNAENLKGRNAANSANVNILKVNASDQIEFASQPYAGANRILDASDKGAANGVASLDGSGKVPVAQLPNAIMEYQGTWNASTNSPALADGVGNADEAIGNVYRVSVAGTQDLGSGSITFAVGDYAILNASKIWEKADTSDAVTSVNGFTGTVVLDTDDVSEGVTNLYYTTARFNTDFATKDTDDLAEGSTNLYFTAARAKAAAVADTITNGVTDVAPSQNAVFDALALKADDSVVVKSVNGQTPTAGAVTIDTDDVAEGVTNLYFTNTRAQAAFNNRAQNLTLNGTDITNGYKDLGFEAKNGTLVVEAFGVTQKQGIDYTLSVVGGVTRITFAGGLASGDGALASGDDLYAQYLSVN